MTSLQFIIPKHQIKYKTATRKAQLLVLQGEDFLLVDTIEINSLTIKDYIKISDNTIIIQLPSILKNVPLSNIILLGRIKNLSNAVLINELSDTVVEGFQKLIQRYIKYFLQSPNSNIFSPSGGGVLKMIGQTTIDDGQSIISRLSDATKIAKDALIKEQSNLSLPLSEKLLDVQILNITMIADDNVQITKQIINKAGQNTSFNLNI
jgi:hypothetical protein